jgi:hypothetical protein
MSMSAIVATEVVQDGQKKGQKTFFFLGPRACSERLGHFKIGPAWPYLLGWSRLSWFIQNTNITNSAQPELVN